MHLGLISPTLTRKLPFEKSFSPWLAEVTGSGTGIHNAGDYQGPDSYILDRTVGNYFRACAPLCHVSNQYRASSPVMHEESHKPGHKDL